MEPYPTPPLAAAMLAEHITLRAKVLAKVAADADQAWQDWIDLPAFARRQQPQIGDWLQDRATATHREAARFAKAHSCAVECSPIGRVYIAVAYA